jgi:hypothetical protein
LRLRYRGPFLTSPLSPRGEICPLGGMFTTWFTPRGEHSLLFRQMKGRTENFTPRGQLCPLGKTSPLGWKFAPRGDVKNGPLALHMHLLLPLAWRKTINCPQGSC